MRPQAPAFENVTRTIAPGHELLCAAEAGYTAGLKALRIPSAAPSTSIAFRLVTFYRPPLWGAFGHALAEAQLVRVRSSMQEEVRRW